MCHKAQSHIALIKNMGQNVTCCLHLLAFMDAWHHNNWLAKKGSSHVDLVIHNILFRWNQWSQAFSSTKRYTVTHTQSISLQTLLCVVWLRSVYCAVSSQAEEEVPIGGYRLSKFSSTAHPESVLKQIFTTCCQDNHIWGARKQHHQFPAPWSAVQRSETRIHNR